MTRIAPYVIAVSALGLSACTNPYDPVQRGLGGGVLGAASGAAIGAAAGGGPGAALGAAIGGATGIFGGVASTPPPPPGTYFGYPAYGYPDTDIRAMRSRAMDTQATRDTPPTPVLRAMDIQVNGSARLWLSGLLGKPRLLRSSGLWIPRLLGTARLPLRGLRIAKQLGIPLLRTPGLCAAKRLGTAPLPRWSGLWISEPAALFSVLRFRLWKSRGWLSRRSPFGGLVAWGRVRDRAC